MQEINSTSNPVQETSGVSQGSCLHPRPSLITSLEATFKTTEKQADVADRIA